MRDTNQRTRLVCHALQGCVRGVVQYSSLSYATDLAGCFLCVRVWDSRHMTPRRAAHCCATPVCPEIVSGPQARCARHTVKRSDSQSKDPAQKRFYSSGHWAQIRKIVLARHPYCQVCRRVPTQEIHHLVDWTCNELDQLQGVCRACHGTITSRAHNAKRNGGS